MIECAYRAAYHASIMEDMKIVVWNLYDKLIVRSREFFLLLFRSAMLAILRLYKIQWCNKQEALLYLLTEMLG